MCWQVQEKSAKIITEMKTKLRRTWNTLDFAETSVRNMGNRNNKTKLNEQKRDTNRYMD